MKYIKYFFQFIFIVIFFIFFKILGPKLASVIGGKLFEIIGPFFRNKKIIQSNIKKAFPNISEQHINKITNLMWNSYGRTFGEYIFLRNFRNGKLSNKIEIKGKEILNHIIKEDLQVIFISGHFSNFELMAMHLEKNGIKLATVYRPLNNIFLNKILERIRNKYICQNQIKKGIGGMRKLIEYKKKNYSSALMIDQRVSEGIYSNFFNQKALTTTIPAQLVKKYNIPVVPVYIERSNNLNFTITINEPIKFKKEDSTENITNQLNIVLEKMILKKPEQWIWSHNRWK